MDKDLKSYATYFQVNHAYSKSECFTYGNELFERDTVYTVFMDYKDKQRVLARFTRWLKVYTLKGCFVMKIRGKQVPYLLPLLKNKYTISDCTSF